MKFSNLNDVFEHDLKDLFSAEKQLVEALPKMAKAAKDERLTKAFEKHLEVTKQHLARIEEAGEALGITVTGHTCEGMKGLIKEGDGLLKDNDKSPALDAALIGAAQRVEHYEMAAYGTAVAHAKELGHAKMAKMLQKTLDEEAKANDGLTALAESSLNQMAAA